MGYHMFLQRVQYSNTVWLGDGKDIRPVKISTFQQSSKVLLWKPLVSVEQSSGKIGRLNKHNSTSGTASTSGGDVDRGGSGSSSGSAVAVVGVVVGVGQGRI